MTVTTHFNEWFNFTDRPVDDERPGPARAVEVIGRCAKCWGPATGTKADNDQWNRIECRLCGQALDGQDAQHEIASMWREAAANLPRARVGRRSEYRERARFVLKMLPDMDRDPQRFRHRTEASARAARERGRLTRREFPPGTPGYLYAQARAFLSGMESLSHETSAIALSDFDFGEPQVVDVIESPADGTVHVSGTAPVRFRKPSHEALMARMGTAVVAGMAASFACEVAMKAILITRFDETERTHDLLKLYRALPPDSQERLEGDFPDIPHVLDKSRHAFGKWRYFEQSVAEDAISALVDTDRVWELGKAARLIVDECVIAGLQYEVHVQTTYDFVTDGDHASTSNHLSLRVDGHEAAIPWDEVLAAGAHRES